MKLIIQIPCYNEESTLLSALKELPTQIDGIDVIERLIINDGSTDHTVEVARAAGVEHLISFKQNRGLAAGFSAGLDACLRLGADIIVNTDADNQYNGDDIKKLVQPILQGKADMVIGERPIDTTESFSWKKKQLQKLGSWVVRVVSKTEIPDAPSGFRAFSREAALRLNVINTYSYTLETIIQAGHSKIAIASVPIRTNPELRPSRLFSSMLKYIKRSAAIIVRAYAMYKPLTFFGIIGSVLFLCGMALGIRYLVLLFGQGATGHIQSLLLAAILLISGFQTILMGIQADVIAANRKLIEDIQYRIRRSDSAAPQDRAEHHPQKTDTGEDIQ